MSNKNNKYTQHLINFLDGKSNKGQNTISIPLKKRRRNYDSFQIHPIYKNSKIIAINVERSVMPIDTVFPIDIFTLVLNALSNVKDFTLPNGKAQGNRVGDADLGPNTIEYIVAKEIYNKDDGNSIDRRISVISNILIAANLCESKSKSLQLKS